MKILSDSKLSTMQKVKIIYWVLTGLTAIMMMVASIPDIILHPQAVAVITHLGYPEYLVPFIGILKILGTITILLPDLPRLKEWAYAGLMIDLTGAVYSHISVADSVKVWIFPLIIFILVVGSYVFYHKTKSDKIPKAIKPGF
jgi:uncharacterized membrane protein YphA (DoxX/SURF4 family)